jgi:hypothetical protein
MTQVQSSHNDFQEPLSTHNEVTFDDDAYLTTMMEADALLVLPSMSFSGLFDVGLNAEELKGKLYTYLSDDASYWIPFRWNANPFGAPLLVEKNHHDG